MKFVGSIKKQLKNPAYGLLPIFIFSVAMETMNASNAILLALGLSLLSILLVKKYCRLIYDISAASFFIVLLLSLILAPWLNTFLIFCLAEILFVLFLIFFRLSRSRIIQRIGKNSENNRVRNYIGESFRVAFQTQYGMSLHLLVILIYFIFNSVNAHFLSPEIMRVIFQIIILCLILTETFRLWILDRKLLEEEWLPVVNQEGKVVGRVAKSVTRGLKNHFMHPVVRVALIHKGKIYLKKRDASRVLNPGLLDYPFEKYMQFDHNINDTVCSSVKAECGSSDDMPLCFLLKYVFENSNTKRLIFLYASIMEDETVFNNLKLKEGKLWTMKQIEDNLNMNIFSECFEMEYEYLKNTVLLAQKLKDREE